MLYVASAGIGSVAGVVSATGAGDAPRFACGTRDRRACDCYGFPFVNAQRTSTDFHPKGEESRLMETRCERVRIRGCG